MAIYVADAHLTLAQLFIRKQETVHTIFPETIGPRLSGIYVATSLGKGTLLLSGEKFTSLGHCCDELREICPAGVEVSNYACGQEVLDAIEVYGESLEKCPKIVALSVEYVPGNGADKQKELAELISGVRSEVVMGEFRLGRLANSWQNTPDGGKGLAYEQSDQIIRTRLHEKNPKSGETAKQKIENDLKKCKKLNRNILLRGSVPIEKDCSFKRKANFKMN